MITPKRIFIDSSAWIELILTKERYHKKVIDYVISEVKKRSKFFTSDYVLDETFTRLITDQSYHTVKTLKEKVKVLEKEKQLLILWTDEVFFNKAWAIFTKFSEHRLSFTDASIVSYTRDLKIDEILTLDTDFKKVGLTTKPIL